MTELRILLILNYLFWNWSIYAVLKWSIVEHWRRDVRLASERRLLGTLWLRWQRRGASRHEDDNYALMNLAATMQFSAIHLRFVSNEPFWPRRKKSHLSKCEPKKVSDVCVCKMLWKYSCNTMLKISENIHLFLEIE